MSWLPDGWFPAVIAVISSLGTLWLSNNAAQRRDDARSQHDLRVRREDFRRAILIDLQDAVAHDHQLALKAARSNVQTHQEAELLGIEPFLNAEIAEQHGAMSARLLNLTARVDDGLVRALAEEIHKLHGGMALRPAGSQAYEDRRLAALSKKKELDERIRTLLY